MGRSPCCDKSKVKRGPWSPEEDTILRNHIQNHGTGGNWIALPHKAASHLQGRTDNDVKNHWNTKLKKKLSSSYISTAATTTSATSINLVQFNSPATLVPKLEVDHHQMIPNPIFDHSMMVEYQQPMMISNSNSTSFNDNISSSQENQGLSPNAFSMGNNYASWSDNGDGMTNSSGDLFVGDFDFQEMLGEVANFNYSSQWS
ncbi:hypothetical protein OSB04_015257 [Centaurea solstitialis]|uniref:Uncharacterized protein n=1 Tax=Centaurea solstitialis TaxID=347529 RepID=A0AA38W7A2_9ASTR|nr:hypothetical protein OSB04_015257 [Centaurea solstitialis]